MTLAAEPPARRVALVTGGARGIGLAIARRLGARGYWLALIDINGDMLNRAAGTLRGTGTEVWTGVGDVSDARAVERLTHEVAAALGPVGVLVNNAGIMGSSPLEGCSDDEWNHVMAVNLSGTFYMCRAVIPQMRRQGYGRIVNITSSAARDPRSIAGAAYVASKAAVAALTRQLAYQLAPLGITVNTVAPGPVDTEMPRTAFPPDRLQVALATVPMGRMAEPDEVAAAVAYLVSDEARFVTGVTLHVAGGAWIE